MFELKVKKGLESSYWITAKAGVWSWVAASLCSFFFRLFYSRYQKGKSHYVIYYSSLGYFTFPHYGV